jgi:uridine phosphorylase
LNEGKAICNPSDFIRYVAKNKNISPDVIRVPQRLVITYQRSRYERASKLIDGRCVDWWMYGDVQPFCIGRFNGVEIGLIRLWIGAPAAAMTLEEVIACGSLILFEVGLSGGLQPHLRVGDIVAVTQAIRDEGTSYHYLPKRVKVDSSPRLRNSLTDHLDDDKIKYSVGPVWSTDTVYRETRSKFLKFKNAGVLAVNMETSAIFAVAKYRNAEAGSAQMISDILTEGGWLQAYEHRSVRDSTGCLLKTVLKVLSEAEECET